MTDLSLLAIIEHTDRAAVTDVEVERLRGLWLSPVWCAAAEVWRIRTLAEWWRRVEYDLRRRGWREVYPVNKTGRPVGGSVYTPARKKWIRTTTA